MLKGFDKLDKVLSKLSDSVDAGEATLAGAEAVVTYAVEIVPVDTGELRDSLIAESLGERAAARATAPYAGFVEFGTSRMAAQPYFRPAAYSEAPAEAMTDVIKKLIKEAV